MPRSSDGHCASCMSLAASRRPRRRDKSHRDTPHVQGVVAFVTAAASAASFAIGTVRAAMGPMDYAIHPLRAVRNLDPARALTAIAYAGGAAILVAYGLGAVALWRKVTLLGAGAGLLYRALSSVGRPGAAAIKIREPSVADPAIEARVCREERDRVDEASYESFPASDPPGYL